MSAVCIYATRLRGRDSLLPGNHGLSPYFVRNTRGRSPIFRIPPRACYYEPSAPRAVLRSPWALPRGGDGGHHELCERLRYALLVRHQRRSTRVRLCRQAGDRALRRTRRLGWLAEGRRRARRARTAAVGRGARAVEDVLRGQSHRRKAGRGRSGAVIRAN
ncbi:hypothetical protein ebA2523 [Aromatoleum aromaticum EbN1]|uniref:Uncharacterized protein n=1 Tax=Aromatoleum aromaticum (strain DSM 19018 / LMG 30748 / EbN1) TaxID=76114 RepID=Q5P564_AROAE|nr:hypothetical protein ebA2523 [Aromatoleum aromaticum EbN1]